jgi:hypothetical protein
MKVFELNAAKTIFKKLRCGEYGRRATLNWMVLARSAIAARKARQLDAIVQKRLARQNAGTGHDATPSDPNRVVCEAD